MEAIKDSTSLSRRHIDSILRRITRFLNSTVEGELSIAEQDELIKIEKELEFYLSRYALFKPKEG